MPSRRCGRPSASAAATTSPASMHDRTYVLEKVIADWSSSDSSLPCSSAPYAAKPKRRPRVRSSATSPAALAPKVKLSPTITAAACSRSTSTSCTNSSGCSRDSSKVKGSTQKTSMPRLSTISALRRNVVSCAGWLPGRSTSDGCGSNVTMTLGSPRSAAAATVRLTSSWCPRWTPSNTPMVTTHRPQPPGRSPSPRHRSTSNSRLSHATLGGQQHDHCPGHALFVGGQGEHPAVGPEEPVGALDAGRRDALAVADGLRRRGVEVAPREGRGHGGVEVEAQLGRLLELVEGPRLGQGEGTDRGAPQRLEVTPDAEVRAEVAGQRADVGAGRALDDGVDLDVVVFVPDAEDVEAVDGDRPRRDDDVLAGADAGVGALAVDLDGAHRARHLLDVAGQLLDAGGDVVVGDGFRVRRRENLALGVVGRGAAAEAEGGQVGLAVQREVAEQLGGALDAEHQHAGRHRVERAGVPDLAGAHDPAGTGDDVVRRHAGGLVDDHETGRRGGTAGRFGARHAANPSGRRSWNGRRSLPANPLTFPRKDASEGGPGRIFPRESDVSGRDDGGF